MLEVAGIAVHALSVGGLETCIDLPGLKLAFDVGRCPPAVVSRPTVLFTHAHVDHLGGIATHCATRSLYGLAPPTYVVPRANADAVRALFEAWRRLDGTTLEHTLVPLEPGEEHALSKELVARPVRTVHPVVSQGYVVWRRKHKLKERYAGLAQDELRRLAVEEGAELTEPAEAPLVAFTGDTRIEAVEREASLREAKVLILECTFLDDRVSVEECRAKGHVHLDEIVERAELFENEALVLTHFSQRYGKDEIVALLEAKLPPSLRERTTPALDGFR